VKETMRNKAVTVSVIVLTYNHKDYIRQALDSVLAQKTAFPYEILVGDDASSDGTSEIVLQYADQYPDKIFPFIREKNLGATKNLRKLLERAKGAYINGCEGDDYWTDPYKLQRQVSYMTAHPQCVGCVHPFTIVDETGRPRRNQRLRWVCEKKVYRLEDFKGIFLPGHSVTLLHKNIFTGNEQACALIERAHAQVADRTIAMLLAAQGEIHRLDNNMACYRQVLRRDGDNLTSKEFAAKADSKLTEYRMNNILEAYVRDVLGIDIRFNWFRRNLLLRAAGKAVLKPSKENFECLYGILREETARHMAVTEEGG